MQLTSTKNPRVQTIRRAAAMGRPTEDGLVVIEGPHLLEEALRGEWRIEQIFATAAARGHYSDLLQQAGAELVELSPRAFAAAAATETPQEVMAVVRPRIWSWKELTGAAALIVILDGIQDPGNAGTIVRSAEAFGATGVVFLKGCVRVSNGKLLRASAGSMFRVPFLEGLAVAELIEHARRGAVTIYALSSGATLEIAEANLGSACALAVGSEAFGLSEELQRVAQRVSIPTEKVESLNAAIACSIALYQASRARNSQ
ncbi:MAG: RNA methyltransferase [Acidobacteriaceae bacterium]|nr:RNA methyltransferase [Acidobacteriaceae bacterium]MBV9779835.1 RNA methyltransferase [Acidobacteriaceae bacterium]